MNHAHHDNAVGSLDSLLVLKGCKDLIRSQLDEITDTGGSQSDARSNSSSTSNINISSSEEEMVHAKKKRYSIMDDVAQQCSANVHLSPIDAEIEAYLSTLLINVKAESFNVCEWWYINKSKFPKLYKLALRTFCVPASSAYVEALFSKAGFLINEKRSNLTSANINDLLFLNSCGKIVVE